MKRKCPYCKSSNTIEIISFKQDKKGNVTFSPGPVTWGCDDCGMGWQPGKRNTVSKKD